MNLNPFLSQPDPIWHIALSFSAVGPILLGRWLEQKTDPKACAAIFVVYFKSQVKKAGGEDFNQFLMDILMYSLSVLLNQIMLRDHPFKTSAYFHDF